MNNSISVRFRIGDKHNPDESMAPEPLACEVRIEYKENPTDTVASIHFGRGDFGAVRMSRAQFNHMVAAVNKVFDESPSTHPVTSR